MLFWTQARAGTVPVAMNAIEGMGRNAVGRTHQEAHMRRWIKWTVGLLLALVLLAVGIATVGLLMAEARHNRRIAVSVAPFALPVDAASLEHGRYLFTSRGCVVCHGAGGGGREFVNNGKGIRMVGPNITPGGVTARYDVADWARTVRQGVKPDDKNWTVVEQIPPAGTETAARSFVPQSLAQPANSAASASHARRRQLNSARRWTGAGGSWPAPDPRAGSGPRRP